MHALIASNISCQDPGLNCPHCIGKKGDSIYVYNDDCIICGKWLNVFQRSWKRICDSHRIETEDEAQAKQNKIDSLQFQLTRQQSSNCNLTDSIIDLRQKLDDWINQFPNQNPQQINTIITDAQRHLGVNDLNQLPQILQGQNLQTLINFYNDGRRQIDNATQERDDIRQRLEQAERRLNDTKNKLNLNQVEELDNLTQLPQEETINQIWEEVQNFRQRNREERIRNQREHLEQLITNARNRLNNNLHATLDDLLEAQKELSQGDNPFAQRLLERFRTRLLDSEQLTEEEINALCQAQTQLNELEIQQRQQNPQFEARQQQGQRGGGY